MIYRMFFIGLALGFILGYFSRSAYRQIKKPFRIKKYDNEYKSFLEFDGS